MADYGYIQLPRSLLNLSAFNEAPAAQRIVFIEIVSRAVFTVYNHNDHGFSIELQPGQLCASMRQLAEWANVDKNDVERGLARFSKAEILRHEVRHRKCVITITHRDTYDLILNQDETESETKVRQK